MRPVSLVSLTVAVFFSLTVSAESLFNCSGVWRSKPCDISTAPGATTSSIASKAPPSPAEQRENDERRASKDKSYLVLQLDLLRFNASKELGLDLSIAPVRLICKEADTSLEQCGNLVTKRQAEIEQMLIEHRQKLREEKNAKQSEREGRARDAGQSVNQTVVTVIRPVQPSPWIDGLPRCCQDTCRYADACQPIPGYGIPRPPHYQRPPQHPHPQRPVLSPGFQYPPAGEKRGAPIPPSADPRHFPYSNLPEFRGAN
jgi:hypothetical protein